MFVFNVATMYTVYFVLFMPRYAQNVSAQCAKYSRVWQETREKYAPTTKRFEKSSFLSTYTQAHMRAQSNATAKETHFVHTHIGIF